MADTNIILHCPKCGESFTQRADQLKIDGPFTCSKCGASVPMGELKTPSGKSLTDYMTDAARDALKGIKGFKPTR